MIDDELAGQAANEQDIKEVLNRRNSFRLDG